MRSQLRTSVMISGLHRAFGVDLRWLVELARVADESGIDQIALSDHVVMGERTDLYPFGKFPFGPEEPWMEPLTTLAAMASVTKRIRLATGIVIAPLRPAALLAKTVATLDVLSGGRVDLGVGIGWQKEEYDASGVSFDKRWQRLDDTMRACRALWRDVPATFASETVTLDRIYSTPLPVQSRVPIWIGAKMTEATAKRIADYGDGWFPLATTPLAEVREGAALLRRAFEVAGRAPASALVRAGVEVDRASDGTIDRSKLTERMAELADAGVSMAAIPMRGVRTMEDARAYFEAIARN